MKILFFQVLDFCGEGRLVKVSMIQGKMQIAIFELYFDVFITSEKILWEEYTSKRGWKGACSLNVPWKLVLTSKIFEKTLNPAIKSVGTMKTLPIPAFIDIPPLVRRSQKRMKVRRVMMKMWTWMTLTSTVMTLT